MSRITDMSLQPNIVYTKQGFLVRVKVQDDYIYKKYLISENLHYKTVQGTSFTLTDADTTKQAEIIEIKGKGKGNLIAKDNWELGSISGSGSTMGQNTPATNRIRNIEHIAVEPNTTYTLTLLGDTSTVAFVFEYNSEKVGTKRIPSTWIATPFTFTTQDTTYFVRVIFSTTDVTLGQNVELRKEGDSVVTGDNNIVVSNKNKLALNKVEKGRIDNGNVGYQNNTTNLEVTNTDITFTTNANYRGVVSDFIPIEILQTINNYVYLLMDNKKAFLTNGAIQISFYDENKNYISANSGYALNDTMQRYAITNNMKFARIWFCLNKQGTVTLEKVCFGYYTDYTEYQGNSYRVDIGGKNLCNFARESNLPLQENITTILDLNTEKTFSSIFVSFELEDAMFTNASSAAIIDYKKADGTHQYRILGTFTNVETGIGMQINTVMNGRYYHQEKNITFKTINIYMGSSYGGFVQGKVKEFQIEESNFLTPYSPYTDNPIELTEQDKIWNNNGTWQLNDTAITDNYLLTQLQALNNIELYENLCYVDWIGIEKPTMTLQYAGTEDLGTKFIITNDGKKIRSDWRRIGEKNG